MENKINVRLDAMKGLAQFLREEHGYYNNRSSHDNVVSVHQLDCKEVRRMNRELGLFTINRRHNHSNK